MAEENGYFKGKVEADLKNLTESDKVLFDKLEMISKKIEGLARVIYIWNGCLSVGGAVGAYLAILLIKHLCG
jgi:hypothetical protein